MRHFEGFQKGVNLGGWISQFDRYDTAHFDTFITEEDIWCEKYGLRMLIDLHECYGYSFDPLKKDMDREKFFYDSALQERFFRLWRRIAEHFSAWPDQVAFEPLNEVVLKEVADAWNKVASGYIRMMRTIVPDSYLIIGGVCYNSVLSVPLLDLPLDDRIVYNFHCYEPHVFTHQGAYWEEKMPLDFRIGYPEKLEVYQKTAVELGLAVDLSGPAYENGQTQIGEGFFEEIFAPALQKAEKDNVPLYCGEYGVIELADHQAMLRWLRDIHAVMDTAARNSQASAISLSVFCETIQHP